MLSVHKELAKVVLSWYTTWLWIKHNNMVVSQRYSCIMYDFRLYVDSIFHYTAVLLLFLIYLVHCIHIQWTHSHWNDDVLLSSASMFQWSSSWYNSLQMFISYNVPKYIFLTKAENLCLEWISPYKATLFAIFYTLKSLWGGSLSTLQFG